MRDRLQAKTGGPRMSESTSASAVPSDCSCLTINTKVRVAIQPSGTTSLTQLTLRQMSYQGQRTQIHTKIPF